MKKPSCRTPALTREKLLAAAFKEIHEHGFQSASLERILANTQLTKGALYHHFATKHALGMGVIDEIVAETVREEYIRPLQQSGDVLDALAAVLQRKIDRATADSVRLGCPLNNLTQEMSPLDESFRDGLRAILNEWTQALAAALARGQAQGQVNPHIDAGQTALFLVAAMEGCVGMGKNCQGADTYQACFRQLQAYLQTLRP